ncbi:MAG: hypothetical protein ACQKBY_12335 [Verrucomicrobiales bacterium]
MPSSELVSHLFMKKALLFFLPVLSSQAAITTGVTGVYDEEVIQANSPDVLATGGGLNNIRINDFYASVASAYALGYGGVINFVAATGSAAVNDTIDATYGVSSEKVLNITNTSPSAYNLGSGASDRTPISGTGFLGKNGGVTDGKVFRFGFDAVDQVTMVAATVMSRSNTGDPASSTITGTVTFSDSSTAVATATQERGNGTSDVFFGFTTTQAQRDAGVYITGFEMVPGNYRGLDDLAFVTVIPEPSSAVLALIAAAGLLRRRRLA